MDGTGCHGIDRGMDADGTVRKKKKKRGLRKNMQWVVCQSAYGGIFSPKDDITSLHGFYLCATDGLLLSTQRYKWPTFLKYVFGG